MLFVFTRVRQFAQTARLCAKDLDWESVDLVDVQREGECECCFDEEKKMGN
jgi:hypothetical protein